MSVIPLFLLLSTFAAAAGWVPMINSWTLSTHEERKFEIISQESTRPLVVGDLLYIANSQGLVRALKRAEGIPVWETRVKFGVSGALSYGRSKLFVGDTGGFLTALNARDGVVSWTVKIQSEWLSPPAIQREKVCASTSAEEIYCFSEKDGRELWHYSRRGDEKMVIRGTASPSIYGDVVYQGFADGNLVALSLEDGRVLWTKKLKTRARFYDVDMPVFADGAGVLVAAFDGNLYHLNRDNGSTLWSFAVGSHDSFLVEGDRFYFSGLNGFFYAMDRNSGTPVWKTPIEVGHGLAPVRVKDLILFSTTSDPVYALNVATGEVVWHRRLGAGTFAGLASSPAEGVFYAMSNYGNLFAFEMAKGLLCRETLDAIALPSAFWPHPSGSPCRT